MCRQRCGLHPQQKSLADVVYEVPCLMDMLTHCEWAALMACSRIWREIVHDSAQIVFLNQPSNIQTLAKRNWHSLSVIVLRQSCDASIFEWFPDYANGSLQLMAHISMSSSNEGGSCTALFVRPWAKKRLCDSPADQQRLTQAMSYFSSATWHPLIQLRIWYTAESVTKQIVVQLRCMLHLTSLDLSNLALLPEDIGVLVQGQARLLNTINLQQCSLSTVAMRHLAAGNWPQLEVLYLSDNKLGDDASSCLVKGSWSKLHVLWLNGNNITTTGLATLLHGPWVELRELRIDEQTFTRQSYHLLNICECESSSKDISHKDIFVYRRLVDETTIVWPRLRFVHVVCEPSMQREILHVIDMCVTVWFAVLTASIQLAFLTFAAIVAFCMLE